MKSNSTRSAHDLLRFTQFAVDSLSDAAYWVEPSARIIYVNAAACRLLGYTKQELLNKHIYDLNPEISESTWPHVWTRLREARRRTFETLHQAKDGHIIPVEIAANLLEFDGEEYSCAFARDITERKELEVRLRQAEKMEAVGRLAGGVAHDFNNQLTAIMGWAEILRQSVEDRPQELHVVDQIIRAVERSGHLTSQLLAFARQGKFLMEPVDLHQLVGEVADILGRSIDKRISVSTTLSASKNVVRGESAQLQSAILNLGLNGRDAMPHGGTLTISTKNVKLDQTYVTALPFETAAGEYIKLCVADSGSGMDTETRKRIFEPFFTTKEKGRGTGLGLAAVYGTVKNHRGTIEIESEPGKGTRASVYLPLADSDARPVEDTRIIEPSRVSAHVLIVDDEPDVRKVLKNMLEGLGCTVTLCEHGRAAMDFLEKSHAEVDLVILDMVMPMMSGRETFRAMREVSPGIKVMLASGYSIDSDAQTVLNEGACGFIQKPYRRSTLVMKIAEVLRKPS